MFTETEPDKKRSFTLVLVVLVVWTTITVLGARLIYVGDIALDEVVKNGIAWQLVAAAVFLIAVITLRGRTELGLRGRYREH